MASSILSIELHEFNQINLENSIYEIIRGLIENSRIMSLAISRRPINSRDVSNLVTGRP